MRRFKKAFFPIVLTGAVLMGTTGCNVSVNLGETTGQESTEEETEKETKKETEKATEKETEKETEKATETETEKETEKATETETEKETEKETVKESVAALDSYDDIFYRHCFEETDANGKIVSAIFLTDNTIYPYVLSEDGTIYLTKSRSELEEITKIDGAVELVGAGYDCVFVKTKDGKAAYVPVDTNAFSDEIIYFEYPESDSGLRIDSDMRVYYEQEGVMYVSPIDDMTSKTSVDLYVEESENLVPKKMLLGDCGNTASFAWTNDNMIYRVHYEGAENEAEFNGSRWTVTDMDAYANNEASSDNIKGEILDIVICAYMPMAFTEDNYYYHGSYAYIEADEKMIENSYPEGVKYEDITLIDTDGTYPLLIGTKDGKFYRASIDGRWEEITSLAEVKDHIVDVIGSYVLMDDGCMYKW